jgi:hypothetical protein
MRPEDFAVVQPYLIQAINDIDGFLTRASDDERKIKKFADALGDSWSRDRDLPDLKTTGAALDRSWMQSAKAAACWLRRFGEEGLAAGIEVELVRLPTQFSTDPNESLYPPNQLPTALAVAQRIKTIGTAILTSMAEGSSVPPPQETKEIESRDSDPDQESGFVFAMQGTGYYISGFGEFGYVNKLKGFGVIARLVQTPGVPVPMRDLVATGNSQCVSDERSRQPTLDYEAQQAIYDRIQQLWNEQATANGQNNNVDASACQAEINTLTDRLKADIGIGGRGRDLNSETRKLRPSIYGNLRTAYNALRSASPPMTELANHFEAAISSEGLCFIYRHTKPIPWADSPRSKK